MRIPANRFICSSANAQWGCGNKFPHNGSANAAPECGGACRGGATRLPHARLPGDRLLYSPILARHRAMVNSQT